MPIKIEQHSFEPAIIRCAEWRRNRNNQGISQTTGNYKIEKKVSLCSKNDVVCVNAVGSIDGARETWRGARSFKC
jgi:hypothetical protein